MPRAKKAKKKSSDVDVSVSYFDLNQLELAFVNRALDNPRRANVPDFVDISRKRRILKIQKKNLMDECKKSGKENRKGPLESELKKILGGLRTLSLKCFLFK